MRRERPGTAGFIIAGFCLASCSTDHLDSGAQPLQEGVPVNSQSKPAGLPGLPVWARVKDERELARMDHYIASRNDARIIAETIRVDESETIDCVTVHLQHGFENPILGFAQPPADARPAGSTPPPDAAVESPQRYGSATRLCPAGTIPRLHIDRSDLIRFETLDQYFRKTLIEGQPVLGQGSTDLHQYGTFQESVTNFGSDATIATLAPSVELSNEFSLSQIWVSGGSGGNKQVVETGWHLYPIRYNDTARSRLFIYYTLDNYITTGCYNLDCSGFVQVSNAATLGGAFASYSTPGTTAWYSLRYQLQQNSVGDWWFGFNNTWIGYWPNSLFASTGIKDSAEKVTYGGEILDRRPSGRHTKTDMGSGRTASAGWGYAGYERNLRYVNGPRSSPTYSDAGNFVSIITTPSCYDATEQYDATWGRYMYFGGQGYDPVLCW